MLHISHRQTIAYHPELNGAVERLHCCLKDVPCARAAAAIWSKEIPFYSSTSVHSRGKTLLFPQLMQFLVLQLSCPTNFCKEMNFLLMKLSKNLKKTLDGPAFSLPRHNSSTQLPAELPDELLRAPFFWLHRSSVSHPASPPPLRRPLCCRAAGTPLLHHQGRVAGRDRLCQPP
jgi:hypothetical protein